MHGRCANQQLFVSDKCVALPNHICESIGIDVSQPTSPHHPPRYVAGDSLQCRRRFRRLIIETNMAAIGAQASRLAKDLALGGTPSSPSRIPRLVYGTAWKKDQTADLVYRALRAGFRGIDTAAQPKHYDERGVGEGVRRAVAEGIVKRQDLFVGDALGEKPRDAGG